MNARLPDWAQGRLKWAILAVAGVWLAWRIVTLGMADQAAYEAGRPDAALGWYAHHPKANLDTGLQHIQRNPDAALAALRAAVDANPAESGAYAAMGQLFDLAGEREQARKAMEIASQLGPQRGHVQMDAAVFWLRQGDFHQALRHIDVVLRHEPGMRPNLFPYLLSNADNPGNSKAFESLLKQEVSWWQEFFVYAVSTAGNPATVRRLFELSQASANPPPSEALGAYLARLQKQGQWLEAWFVWLGSLSKRALTQSGHVYNGGFELPISGIGYDWIYRPDTAVLMETATTYGTTGERALHLVFRGLRIRFEHLHQYLLLPPGNYYLSGRVRPDNLKAGKGMQWALYCLGKPEPLLATDLFNGLDQWTRFRQEFAVPESCPVQMLRLELAGRIDLDYDVSGGIWFDDLTVIELGREREG